MKIILKNTNACKRQFALIFYLILFIIYFLCILLYFRRRYGSSESILKCFWAFNLNEIERNKYENHLLGFEQEQIIKRKNFDARRHNPPLI